MTKIPLAWLICGAALVAPFGAAAPAKTPEHCEAPKTGTKEAPIFSPPVADIVIGVGRVQFYSAPNFHCAMAGVFVIPKDQLIEYARTGDGWSSVTDFDPKAGGDAEGWVRSARLKATGNVGPKQ